MFEFSPTSKNEHALLHSLTWLSMVVKVLKWYFQYELRKNKSVLVFNHQNQVQRLPNKLYSCNVKDNKTSYSYVIFMNILWTVNKLLDNCLTTTICPKVIITAALLLLTIQDEEVDSWTWQAVFVFLNITKLQYGILLKFDDRFIFIFLIIIVYYLQVCQKGPF